MLIVDAIAGEDGIVTEIQNSLCHPVYRDLRKILHPDAQISLIHKEQSSIIGVEARRGELDFDHLSLAMWKDATI